MKLICLVILLFAAIIASGCINRAQVEQGENSTTLGEERIANAPASGTRQAPFSSQNGQCQKPVFTEYFVDPSYVLQIGQVGTVHGSGQFIVERSYISIKSEFNRQKVPIYAPTNLVLTRGAYYQVPAPAGQYLGEPLPDYVVYFDAGCSVEIAWGHLKELVLSIAQQFSDQPKGDSRTEELRRVEFKAGDLIGYFIPGAGVAAFDFIAYDQSVTNQFANQARHEYGYGDTLLHAVCPYDFYTREPKEAYYNLIGGRNNSSQNKSCGSISRDFPGTISGMWFFEKEVNRSIYEYAQQGIYGNTLSITGDIDRVVIGTIGNRRSTFIYPNDQTYKDPKDVTSEHCYRITAYENPSQSGGYIFFKLVNRETLKVFYSENGQCPASFPSTGGATYYR